tara:strand:+ start:643 stop:882 length:240 start_codon:yes stop_codon:yes gene_type:complete
MNLNNKNYCDECKKEIIENEDGSYDDCLWVAKDGREYCNYCYQSVWKAEYFYKDPKKIKWVQIKNPVSLVKKDKPNNDE